MNKKLQSIETQINTAKKQYNDSLRQYQDTINSCDQEIDKCKVNLDAAAEKDDLKSFESISTQKQFFESKKRINESKKAYLEKNGFMDDSEVEKLTKQLQIYMDNKKNEVEKKLAELTVQANQIAEELAEELEKVWSIQTDLDNLPGDHHNKVYVEGCVNARGWAEHFGKTGYFLNYKNAHPELKL